ncbi:GNAT family N-acetyltransferase [Planococcus sp. YIM B11945]|uniref:GNAT family N-acetyltransferase n=1 Tax=Planococcus sp. YIM B11945 TaxID=3435410 RepID=UPI003D7D26BB
MKEEAIIFPVLETERLYLRTVVEEDARSMMVYLSDPEVMKYYGLDPFEHIEEALSEVVWYQSIFKDQTGMRWAITLKGQDEMIGSCGFLNHSSKNHRADIGYELAKSHWGKGLMHEALAAVIQYGFEQWQLQRIQALIEPPNSSSIKTVEKLGFMQEGLLRSYEFTGRKFDDLYMYSLLKSEFEG